MISMFGLEAFCGFFFLDAKHGISLVRKAT